MKTQSPGWLTAALLLCTFCAAGAQENPSTDSLAQAIRLTDFGVEAASRGLWDEAKFRWEQALSVYPNFPAAHNNLAVANEHEGSYDLARIHYQIAIELTEGNRFIESNARMFDRFYGQWIEGQDEDEGQEADEGADVAIREVSSRPSSRAESVVAVGDEPVYRKVGPQRQILIRHPQRATELSGRYRRVYIAGFSPMSEDEQNLNFETSEYLRSELRKYTMYELVALEELSFPTDEDEFYELVDDAEFFRNLGSRVGADLIVSGRIGLTAEASDGFFPYEYIDRRTGEYRTAQMMVQRTAMTIELELFFHEAATGEIVHEDGFGQTIVYRGRLDPTLQVFFDVMGRVVPRFLDILGPREHTAIRFLLNG